MQALPSAMQRRPLGSQQPAPHEFPAQHGSPGAPHAVHTSLEQVVPAAVQVAFEQRGCPGPPHAAHEAPEQVTFAAVHWLFAQHA